MDSRVIFDACMDGLSLVQVTTFIQPETWAVDEHVHLTADEPECSALIRPPVRLPAWSMEKGSHGTSSHLANWNELRPQMEQCMIPPGPTSTLHATVQSLAPIWHMGTAVIGGPKESDTHHLGFDLTGTRCAECLDPSSGLYAWMLAVGI